jgi:hypothetical protein
MFTKKPATPKAPWAVRLLTTDFLVDGYSDNETHPESWPFFTPATGTAPAGLLWLDRPRFTPVSTGTPPQPPASQWMLPFSASYVAVLPFDDASLAAMSKNAADRKNAFPAIVHVGPFALRGKLMSEYAAVSYMSTMATHMSYVMQEVEIEYRGPNPGFTGLKSPLALVRTHLLQGIAFL